MRLSHIAMVNQLWAQPTATLASSAGRVLPHEDVDYHLGDSHAGRHEAVQKHVHEDGDTSGLGEGLIGATPTGFMSC